MLKENNGKNLQNGSPHFHNRIGHWNCKNQAHHTYHFHLFWIFIDVHVSTIKYEYHQELILEFRKISAQSSENI